VKRLFARYRLQELFQYTHPTTYHVTHCVWSGVDVDRQLTDDDDAVRQSTDVCSCSSSYKSTQWASMRDRRCKNLHDGKSVFPA